MFILDGQVSTTVRTNMNIWNVLSATGGIVSIIIGVFSILVEGIQKAKFFSSMI
jgi:hypothetical protein